MMRRPTDVPSCKHESYQRGIPSQHSRTVISQATKNKQNFCETTFSPDSTDTLPWPPCPHSNGPLSRTPHCNHDAWLGQVSCQYETAALRHQLQRHLTSSTLRQPRQMQRGMPPPLPSARGEVERHKQLRHLRLHLLTPSPQSTRGQLPRDSAPLVQVGVGAELIDEVDKDLRVCNHRRRQGGVRSCRCSMDMDTDRDIAHTSKQRYGDRYTLVNNILAWPPQPPTYT